MAGERRHRPAPGPAYFVLASTLPDKACDRSSQDHRYRRRRDLLPGSRTAPAPAVLLPHGYPSSSFQFRHFMPALADRWRLLAPDFPGFGYSDTPAGFTYSFD